MQGSRSFYEQLRGDINDDTDDVEQRAAGGEDVDEDNWAQNFREQDLDHMGDLAVDDSRMTVDSRAKFLRGHETATGAGSKWPSQDDEADNDVPASLLVERHAPPQLAVDPNTQRPSATKRSDGPKPSSRKTEAQWARAQAQQPLHDVPAPRRPRTSAVASLVTGSDKERAMWRWINVSNLDVFMKEVYEYYLGSGFWCIVCERILHLV